MTKYESKRNSQIPTLKLYSELTEIWKPKLTFNNRYFIYFMNWKKLGSPTTATLTNAKLRFSSFELGKN